MRKQILLLTLAIFFGFYHMAYCQTMIEWETDITDNGATITSTELAGNTITISATLAPDGMGGEVDINNPNGYAGTSGNTIFTPGSGATTITFSFANPVDITSVYHADPNGFAETLTFTPTGGSNSPVNSSHLANSGATAPLNWTDVTSFTISGASLSGQYFIDKIIASNSSSGSSMDVVNTLAASNITSASAETGEIWTQGFTIGGSDVTLDEIKLNLFVNDPAFSAVARVTMRTASSVGTGTEVEDFGTVTVSSTDVDNTVTFTSSTNPTLSASTTYYVNLIWEAGSSTIVRWNGSTSLSNTGTLGTLPINNTFNNGVAANGFFLDLAVTGLISSSCSTETFSGGTNSSASGNPFSATFNTFDFTGSTLSSVNAFFRDDSNGYTQITGNRLNEITIKKNGGGAFKLEEIVFEVGNVLTVDDNITVTGYKNDSFVHGASTTFLLPGAIGTEMPVDFSSITAFNDIDEIRVNIADDGSFGGIRIESIETCDAITPACTDPDIPMLAATPATVCTGESASLTITGNLNDATAWQIYTGSCGGTSIGNTASSTFAISGAITTPTTYFVRGEGGCVSPSTCASITITPQAIDDASFSYSSGIYCPNGSDPVPTITGATGGSFSSTVGLSLNTTTGAIDLSASTPATYTVTYTTAGTCPNSSDFVVAIGDNIPPAISVTDLTLFLDTTGNASITTGDIDNGSSDNCGIASINLSKTEFTCADLGMNTVILTVFDVNGNSATATAAVTVVDNNEPEISITVSPMQVDEDADNITLIFTFTRTSVGCLPDLPVSFSVSGTADYNNDYYLVRGANTFTSMGGTVTIPAGQSSVEVILQAQQDAINEQDETIILTIDNP